MIRRFLEFVFGVISLFLGLGLGKLDILIFRIMADMLQLGIGISIIQTVELFLLLIIFAILLIVLILPLLCGIYLIGDSLGLDIDDF